jgi:pimeloyl-ACP methyl ester carboxylesterase
VRLAYCEAGAGDPVVFIHGAISDHRFWAAQIPDFEQEYCCLAVDQRYCGSSWTEPADSYNLSTHAKDLGEFVSTVIRRPAHVVATSYGSAVALAWAASNPQDCASLFLNEPALPSLVTHDDDLAVLRRSREDLAPVAAALSAGDAALAVSLFCDWTAFPGAFATMPREVQAIFTDNARTLRLALAAPTPKLGPKDLSPINAPVTLTVGEHTTPFFLVQVHAAHRALPQSRLFQVLDSHHAAPLQNPASFNAALREHLRASRHAAA